MFKVVLIGWADQIEQERDFGLDIAGALEWASERSGFGDIDYALVFDGPVPRLKYQDGETKEL